MTTLPQLRRIRWAVRAALVLGVAASVVANVLHAVDNPISQSIAAWPPLALLLTVELISRIPVHSRALACARVVATATIAGIAAWVSYWHMAGVAARYGETGASPYLLPLSVDGLIVVASICLVELARLIRAAEEQAAEPLGELLGEPVTEPLGEPVPDPWSYAVPISTEPLGEPSREPLAEPVREPVRRRVRAKSLTAAERVTAAHTNEPGATHERIAKLAKVSVSTVKRYRPTGSPSETPPAETAARERVNGARVELAGVTS